MQSLSSATIALTVPGFFLLNNSHIGSLLETFFSAAVSVHIYLGVCGVVTDYVPNFLIKFGQVGALVLAIVVFLGLTKAILDGNGIVGNVRSLFRKND
ncbi:hypothetical protein MHBO_004581 [Bonamia ostreae]|uniref:Succinate dehydrogenase [ubiquinone] cytochrome b small subunit n=1 Tax=Bonamia ostreae TaxID=126728 RepID=A0ABV2AUH8_9EUKA